LVETRRGSPFPVFGLYFAPLRVRSLAALSLSLSLSLLRSLFFALRLPADGIVLSFSLRLSLGETFIGSSPPQAQSATPAAREGGREGGGGERRAKYSLVFISIPNEFAGRFSRMHARIHDDRAARRGAFGSTAREERSVEFAK